MHFSKKGQKNWAWVDPPPHLGDARKKTFFFLFMSSLSQQCTCIQAEQWCSKSLAVNFLYHLGLDISQGAAKWLQGEGIARKITDEVDRVVSKLKKCWRVIRSTSKIDYSFSQHIFPAQSHQEKKSHHSVSMMRHHPLPYQNVLASNSAGCDGRRTVHIQFATCQPNFFRQVHLSTYLISVIFFTRGKFLENKIYTEKTRKLRQNTQ